ncbi:hypothetical protein [Armatimonas rosea]|uniref:Uncharacterized protein n=1 Tax=Armatimonas rosea TaxID=685828 RepID=A0A7W9SWR8_ARMRO|nr:hypothetical protein [Armatimonas rosea]MBB6053634.1 hypothetical protein [Armatimonas rosea]
MTEPKLQEQRPLPRSRRRFLLQAALASGWLAGCGGGGESSALPTKLTYTSEPGETLGAGKSETLRQDGIRWQVTTTPPTVVPGRITVDLLEVTPANELVGTLWSFTLTPPNGEDFVVGRTYEIGRFADATKAGLIVIRGPFGCESASGKLTLYELERDGTTLRRLVAGFEHYCETNPHALRGELVYVAT